MLQSVPELLGKVDHGSEISKDILERKIIRDDFICILCRFPKSYRCIVVIVISRILDEKGFRINVDDGNSFIFCAINYRVNF